MRFTPNPVFQRLELRYGTEGKGYGCWLGRGGNIQGHTAARQASQEDGDTCAEPGKGGGRVGPHVGRPLGKPRRRGVAAEDPQQGLNPPSQHLSTAPSLTSPSLPASFYPLPSSPWVFSESHAHLSFCPLLMRPSALKSLLVSPAFQSPHISIPPCRLPPPP